jgi:hypothetical protein
LRYFTDHGVRLAAQDLGGVEPRAKEAVVRHYAERKPMHGPLAGEVEKGAVSGPGHLHLEPWSISASSSRGQREKKVVSATLDRRRKIAIRGRAAAVISAITLATDGASRLGASGSRARSVELPARRDRRRGLAASPWIIPWGAMLRGGISPNRAALDPSIAVLPGPQA